MFFKVVTLALVFVVSQCHGHDHAYSSQHISMHHGKHVPVYVKVHDKHGKKHHHDFYAHPKYKYDYKIKDHHTGDDKTHHETRHGDVVKGTYSLHEPDGRRRVVDYTADKHTGFHASVRHEGHAKHIVPKKHKHHHKHHDDPQKHDHHQFDGVSHSIPNFGSPNTGFTPSFGVPNLGSTPNFDGLPRFSGIPNRVPHFYGTPHSSRVPHFGGNSHDRVPNLKSNSKNRLPYFSSTSNGPMPNFDSNSNGPIPNFDSGPKDRSPHYDHIPRYGQTHHYDDFNGFDVPDFF